MPRSGLTTATVLDEACALIDERGRDALTLATLAARLDVKAPSLYKHIDGLGRLQQQVAVSSKAELARRLHHSIAGRSGEHAVQALADAYRHWALAHPGRYGMTIAAPNPADHDDVDASQDLFGVVGSALASFGLDSVSTVDAIRHLRALLHGFVELEIAGAFAMPLDLEQSFQRALAVAIDSFTRSGSGTGG